LGVGKFLKIESRLELEHVVETDSAALVKHSSYMTELCEAVLLFSGWQNRKRLATFGSFGILFRQNVTEMSSVYSLPPWWWCYPNPSEGWGRGGTPRRPNSRATPQGLDRGKINQRLVASSWWHSPRSSFECGAEMARQLSRGVRPSGHP